MTQNSILIEVYQIPQFYTTLQSLGFTQKQAQAENEAFRGEFKGESIVIYQSGRVKFSNESHIEEKVNQVIDILHIQPLGKSRNAKKKFAVLATKRKSDKKRRYFHKHLNVWLTVEQYYQAIEYFMDQNGTIEKNTKNHYEEKVFQRNGHELKFHLNGKVISETGYKTFAPYLREILRENIPYKDYDLIIGQDEVGNGEKIGPLVISAVAATPEQMLDLQLAGIKDSKMIPQRLTPVMRSWVDQLATESHVWKLEPHEYNQVMLGQNYQLNDILKWGHTKVHYGLIDKMDDRIAEGKKILLVDRFDWNVHLDELEKNPFIDSDIVYASHGEHKSISVAAASIISKARQYRWIKLYEKLYNIDLTRKNIRNIQRKENATQLLKI